MSRGLKTCASLAAKATHRSATTIATGSLEADIGRTGTAATISHWCATKTATHRSATTAAHRGATKSAASTHRSATTSAHRGATKSAASTHRSATKTTASTHRSATTSTHRGATKTTATHRVAAASSTFAGNHFRGAVENRVRWPLVHMDNLDRPW